MVRFSTLLVLELSSVRFLTEGKAVDITRRDPKLWVQIIGWAVAIAVIVTLVWLVFSQGPQLLSLFFKLATIFEIG